MQTQIVATTAIVFVAFLLRAIFASLFAAAYALNSGTLRQTLTLPSHLPKQLADPLSQA